MAAMRLLALAPLVAAALLFPALASADEPPPPAPTAAAPAAPAPVAPPPAAAPPAYAAPGYGPAYTVPYALYPAAYARPRGSMAARPVTERRSDGMRITGITMFAAGGVISAFGGVMVGIASTGCADFATPIEDGGGGTSPPSPEPAHERVGSARQALNGCNTSPELGLGLLAAGALVAAAGIPFLVIGSKQVPVRPTIGNLVPVVSLGAGHGTLRWTF